MGTAKLSKKERLIRQVKGQEIDKVPSIGGWIGGAVNLAEVAGISIEKYLSDPRSGVLKAYQSLGVDGLLVDPIVTKTVEEIRTGSVTDEHFKQIEPEAVVTKADSYPDSEKEVLKGFDLE